MVRWNLAAVVGVPGVGKTSLCRHASQSLGYNYINYGELMLKVAKDRELAFTQEEIFKLPLDSQYKIWKKAAFKIKDQKDVLVDLHGIDRSPKGYLISLPLEILTPQIIILIESSYNNIIKRRAKDHHRKRPIENMKNLKRDMGLLRRSMIVCSLLLNSYFTILINDEFEKSLSLLETYL